MRTRGTSDNSIMLGNTVVKWVDKFQCLLAASLLKIVKSIRIFVLLFINSKVFEAPRNCPRKSNCVFSTVIWSFELVRVWNMKSHHCHPRNCKCIMSMPKPPHQMDQICDQSKTIRGHIVSGNCDSCGNEKVVIHRPETAKMYKEPDQRNRTIEIPESIVPMILLGSRVPKMIERVSEWFD
jgi:hypothetical protein